MASLTSTRKLLPVYLKLFGFLGAFLVGLLYLNGKEAKQKQEQAKHEQIARDWTRSLEIDYQNQTREKISARRSLLSVDSLPIHPLQVIEEKKSPVRKPQELQPDEFEGRPVLKIQAVPGGPILIIDALTGRLVTEEIPLPGNGTDVDPMNSTGTGTMGEI